MTWIKLTHAENYGTKLNYRDIWVNLSVANSIVFHAKGEFDQPRSVWKGKAIAVVALGDKREIRTVVPSEIAALKKFLESAG